MTEDKARRTRCCGPVGTGIIDPQIEGILADEYTLVQARRYCVASDCMGWVWDYGTNKELMKLGSSDFEGRCGLAK